MVNHCPVNFVSTVCVCVRCTSYWTFRLIVTWFDWVNFHLRLNWNQMIQFICWNIQMNRLWWLEHIILSYFLLLLLLLLLFLFLFYLNCKCYNCFPHVFTLLKRCRNGGGGGGGGVSDAWRRSEVASSNCQPSVDVEPTRRNDANHTFPALKKNRQRCDCVPVKRKREVETDRGGQIQRYIKTEREKESAG